MPNASDYFAGPPDLAIEVVSPSDLYTEVDEKIGNWLAAGCQAVVVIDPRRRRATVHRRDAAVVSLGSADSLVLADLLPGWSLPLGEVFTVQPSS
jgi:Uma2 family endonuclease